ncbi:MAG: hypothetical protein A2Y56_08320 [Candidatus Aminicenantes bacterium RBG_13_63_10]|nr:MAG: hypothetical protein A2Y56_08320 [Candidatus Aminicenantes bacterium RBG_13_63_10]
MAKEDHSKEKPFSSWKEISAYLGCDERTCLRWEKKHGLPVHRAGSKLSKSLVFAYREELDDWLRRRETGDSAPKKPRGVRRSFLGIRIPIWLASIPVVLIAALLMTGLVGKIGNSGLDSPQPYSFKIERSELVVLDRQGAELWRFDTRLPNLYDNDSYQRHFPCRKGIENEDRKLPWVKIEDIDSDGRTEVLFMVRTFDDYCDVGLYCFDDRGRKLWTYTPGRKMTFGTRHFSEDYALDAVDVISPNTTGEKFVIVLARHIPHFPSYIVLFAPDGKTRGEYWNAGRFSDYALVDIDDDGLSSLYVSGTNNEYGKGFLAVLDVNNLWGCSPQTPEYLCPDLKAGSEMMYILFPRTVVDRLEFAPRDVIGFVDRLKNHGIYAVASMSRVIFEFSQQLEINSVSLSDAFREKYRKYQEEGRIPPGRLDEQALTDSLTKGLMYFDGERWSMTRTWNKKNLWMVLEEEGKKTSPASGVK